MKDNRFEVAPNPWNTKFTRGMNYLPMSVVLACIMHISPLCAQRTKQNHAPAELLMKKVPRFFAQTILDSPVDSNYFKGKVTFLNFFSFGCSPCYEEVSFMNGISKQYADSGLRVLCVASASRDDVLGFIDPRATRFKKVKERYRIDTVHFEVIAACDADKSLLPKRPCQRIAEDFKVLGRPVSFLIDRSGVFVKYMKVIPYPRINATTSG